MLKQKIKEKMADLGEAINPSIKKDRINSENKTKATQRVIDRIIKRRKEKKDIKDRANERNKRVDNLSPEQKKKFFSGPAQSAIGAENSLNKMTK